MVLIFNISQISRLYRKMNNRVAAQNARDRRKHYLEDLERKVALLEEQVLNVCSVTHTHTHTIFSAQIHLSCIPLTQNKQLQKDNQLLRERTDTLAAEKQQLEQQLISMDQKVVSLDQTDFLSALVKESLLESHGSAAPAVSLQQKQVIPSALLIQAWTVIRWANSNSLAVLGRSTFTSSLKVQS